MNKKMIITFAIAQVLLIGSLLVIATSDNENNIINDQLIDACSGDCSDCNSECDRQDSCKSIGNENCDGTGTCYQVQQRNNNCNSFCSGTGSCNQEKVKVRNCNTVSECSGACNN